MPYKHGTYGQITDSIVSATKSADTVACYIGTAPIHLISNYADKNLINNPIKLTSYAQALQTIGYSDDFKSYTLCEAIAQHFDNNLGNVGPVYVINVFDPAAKTAEVTEDAAPESNQIILEGDNIILDTLTIADKVAEEDYTAVYKPAKKQVVITFKEPTAAAVKLTYSTTDPTDITEADIIGEISSDGVYSGLEALALLYQKHNAVLNLLAAPGWSQIPAVYNAMCSKVQSLNGHWDGFVNADIPLVDSEGKAIDTIQKAIAWKTENGYTSKFSKVYWPMAKDNVGRSIHLSTIGQKTMVETDLENDSIPFESPSNKTINATELFFGEGSRNQGFDQVTANDLNEKGITTAVYWAGRWVLWGPHTAAYNYGGDMDPQEYFESNIRMLEHLCNQFQIDHAAKIDQPMDMNLRDTILMQETDKLDRLKAIGALIGEDNVNYIEFNEVDNPSSSIIEGDFVFHILVTATPPFKSGTAKVTYTDAGLSSLYE